MRVDELFRCFGDETFAVVGGRVCLNRYRAEWEVEQYIPTDDGSIPTDKETVLNVMMFTSKDKLDEYIVDDPDKFTVTEIDQTGNEWIEGMEFPGYTEARAAFDMGEASYKQSVPPTLGEMAEAVNVLNDLVDTLIINAIGGSE